MQRQKLGTRQTERHAERHAVPGQSLAMAPGVLVALLDRLRQGEQNRLRLFQRIDGRLAAQHRPDARAHYGGMQRLGQEFVRPAVDAGDFVLHPLDVGQHQDGDELRPAVRLHHPAEFRPPHAGHHEVEDDQVHLLVLQKR